LHEKNRQTHFAFWRVGTLLALVVPLLAACGGGGGGGDAPSTADTGQTTSLNGTDPSTIQGDGTDSETTNVTPQAPATMVVLELGSPSLPYTASIKAGAYYYQVTGLTAGHRYAINVTYTGSTPTIRYFSDAYSTEITDDPNNYQTFVASGSSIWIRVSLTNFESGTVTINAKHLSAPEEFEGAWDAPRPIDASSGNTSHVGKVDEYTSYYEITGLTVGKAYTFWTHSMTEDVRMGIIHPTQRIWYGGYCSPNNTYLNYKWVPENCTWTATDTKLIIGIDNSSRAQGAAYILRVKESLVSEGSAIKPVSFNYTGGKAAAAGRVSIGGTSYYRVSGLQAGMNYLLTLNNMQWEISRDTAASLIHYGNDSTYTTPGTCARSNVWPIQCQLTSGGSELYFKVVGPATNSGVTYNLSVTPVPVTEGGGYQVPPVVVPASSLPYKGQVGEFDSDYTITGLRPNTYYQVFMNDITGDTELQTWSSGTGVTNCLSPESQSNTTCALYSDANGVITKIRASHVIDSLGSFFTIDVKPATLLTTKYQDKSGPIAIEDPTSANNPVTPTLVPIVVNGDTVTSISNVTVELFIRHGYASDLTIDLIAPDGVTIVNLVEKGIADGTLGFYNTKLSDYATRTLETNAYPYNSPYYAVFWPRTPLHVLNGMNANGTWTLRIKDDRWTNYGGQTGEYYAWGISFQ